MWPETLQCSQVNLDNSQSCCEQRRDVSVPDEFADLYGGE